MNRTLIPIQHIYILNLTQPYSFPTHTHKLFTSTTSKLLRTSKLFDTFSITIYKSFSTSTSKPISDGKGDLSTTLSPSRNFSRRKPQLQSIPKARFTLGNNQLVKDYSIPYKFRIVQSEYEEPNQFSRSVTPELNYSEFSGNRFPTLSTAENYQYWKDKGLDKLITRRFPFKIPAHRKIDPLMRSYFYFLHSFDATRFTDSKIGERFGLKANTVQKIRHEFELKKFMDDCKLGVHKSRRITREEAVAQFKENLYADYVGYQFRGEEETHTEKQTKGHKATSDWLNLQAIQVESMSAFPLMEKRDPSLKRVDVDITVVETPKHKVMNWIDPTEKIVI